MKKLLIFLSLIAFSANAAVTDLSVAAIKSTGEIFLSWTDTSVSTREIEGYFTRTNSKLVLPWTPAGTSDNSPYVWCCFYGKGYYHFRIRAVGDTEWSNTAIVRVQ